ncbi:MAG: type II secretion system F family protein [Rhodospirillaceae bacterium]
MLDVFANFGLSELDRLTLMAAGSAFIAVVTVWSALLERDPMAKRAKALKATRAGLRDALIAPKRRGGARPGDMSLNSVAKKVVDKLNLLKAKNADEMARKLANAGHRSKDALVIYLFAKLIMPFVLGGLAILYLKTAAPPNLNPGLHLPIALVAVLFGALLPGIWLKNLVDRRRKALRKGLPDALDLLVICAEAGLSLDAALSRVAKEMGRSSPEIADEFGLCAIELGFLPERRSALDNLSKRVDLQEFRSVVNTLLQTERYGTPLSKSLTVLSREFRNERMLKAEDKAARLPATLTVPMIIFILPALFVVLLGPAAIQALDGLTGAVGG